MATYLLNTDAVDFVEVDQQAPLRPAEHMDRGESRR